MNRLLPAALCFCAAAFLSNPAWSFQGFDLFEQIQHSIECARKPGTDYLTCTNKVVLRPGRARHHATESL